MKQQVQRFWLQLDSSGRMMGVLVIIFFMVQVQNLVFGETYSAVDTWALPKQWNEFLSRPWTLLTFGWVHVQPLHLISNLILLQVPPDCFCTYFLPPGGGIYGGQEP